MTTKPATKSKAPSKAKAVKSKPAKKAKAASGTIVIIAKENPHATGSNRHGWFKKLKTGIDDCGSGRARCAQHLFVPHRRTRDHQAREEPMMSVPINEDSDAAWVATFLSEAVLAFADSEDRDVTVAPFSETNERPVDLLSDRRVEGFTLRFGPPGETGVSGDGWLGADKPSVDNQSWRAPPTVRGFLLLVLHRLVRWSLNIEKNSDI